MTPLPIVRGIEDVVARNLCTGCGTCAFLQPTDIAMVDDIDHGRRPIVADGADTERALSACPGVAMEHPKVHPPHVDETLLPDWGPVLDVWEGYAVDPEIRFRGSSGGVATALGVHCVTDGGMEGVLHTAADPEAPLLNRTVFSRTRDDVVDATGSRYAPASPCDGLDHIAEADGPSVMIGKPCDIAGARQAARFDPELAEKLGLTIGIFCAGTPSTKATIDLARRMGFGDPAAISSVRYRGHGWPGDAEVTGEVDGVQVTRRLSYEESWGDLQSGRQWRCHVCLDHTGEFADIAVGDPWYRPIAPGEPGSSLIVVRTPRGRQALHDAVAAGHLIATRVEPGLLPQSQPNLRRTRGAVWARIVVSRLLGIAAPRYRHMPARHLWWQLGTRQKASSVIGTVRRVRRRRLRRRVTPVAWDAPRRLAARRSEG